MLFRSINALLLFVTLYRNDYFSLNNVFNKTNLKITLVSIISIYIFSIFIKLSEEYLLYGSELKLFTIILLVVITILIYVLISLLTKTFKYSDIKLKY